MSIQKLNIANNTIQQVSTTTYADDNNFGEIRRGKNGNLYVSLADYGTDYYTGANAVANTAQLLVVNQNATNVTTSNVAFSGYANKKASLQYGLPLQPYKKYEVQMQQATYARIVGNKQYEFTDHLGNVRTVMSDVRAAQLSTDGINFVVNTPSINMFADYYPFGMQMPGITYSAGEYRYGFNGMEKDDEVKGEGYSYDFGARIYDSRIGRWLSLDPKASDLVEWSPYVGFGNNPIYYIDPDGEKFVNPYEEDNQKAEQSLINAKKILEKLKENNASKSEVKNQKNKIKNFKSDFNSINKLYNEVESYYSTLERSNKDEYDYFNTLEDKKGNEILITVNLEDVNTEGSNVGVTKNFAKFPDFTPTSSDGGIQIYLYRVGTNGEADFGFEAYQTGRNYRTFANELGDVKYFFENISDLDSYTFWTQSAHYKAPKYDHPKGAGQQSFDYEQERVKDVKNYAKENNQLINTNGTIE